jgi:hypothetical protein
LEREGPEKELSASRTEAKQLKDKEASHEATASNLNQPLRESNNVVEDQRAVLEEWKAHKKSMTFVQENLKKDEATLEAKIEAVAAEHEAHKESTKLFIILSVSDKDCLEATVRTLKDEKKTLIAAHESAVEENQVNHDALTMARSLLPTLSSKSRR